MFNIAQFVNRKTREWLIENVKAYNAKVAAAAARDANRVADGDYVPKWKHEDKLKQIATHTMNCKNGYTLDLENKLKNPEVKVIVNGHRYNVT